jgi:hypothetical protein
MSTYKPRTEGSDVDLLVVMPARNDLDQAVRISLAFESPFSLDLIVRTPERLERDWQEGDWLLREVMSKGKVLYAETDRPLGPESRGGHSRSAKPRTEHAPTETE